MTDVDIIGESETLVGTLEKIRSVAGTAVPVLVLGESGVGKELIARTIHRQSEARRGPLVRVNCAAVPRELFESEFFGHAKGSFTGAHESRAGRFETASGGTLFLDEVSEIPLGLQVKFLRAVQEREVLPVGATHPKKVDVRIVAATNKDLRDEMQAGRFREDLFYRLNVVTLRLPSLAERPEDIEPLIEHFVEEMAASYGVGPKTVSPEARARLLSYPWPGNARELQNVIERAFALSDASEISLSDVDPALGPTPGDAPPPANEASRPDLKTLEDSERELIATALEESGGNKNEAARLLGIDRQRLYRKIEKYQLK